MGLSLKKNQTACSKTRGLLYTRTRDETIYRNHTIIIYTPSSNESENKV